MIHGLTLAVVTQKRNTTAASRLAASARPRTPRRPSLSCSRRPPRRSIEVLVATVDEECHQMSGNGHRQIGISLLTLVPGIVGGSETHAIDLIRALARVGSLGYRVFVPTIAADAADGLPGLTVSAYRARRDTVGRAVA